MRPRPTIPTVRPRSEAVSGKAAFSQCPARRYRSACGQPAHRHDHEPERRVGDLLVEHARRVGDDDSALRRRPRVDMVVTDAEAGDDLEIGQPAHIGVVDPAVPAGHGERAEARPPFSEPGLGIRFEPQAMQRQTLGDQVADQPHAFGGHQNIEGFHVDAPTLPTFAPRPDMAHAGPMTGLNGAHQARRRPLVRRLMLQDFRSYAALDLSHRRPSRRPMRRERRRQDQSPRSAVAVFAGARPAPGGACRMRAGRRRRRLCAVDRNRGGRRDPSTRLGVRARDERGRAGRRNRIDRMSVASSRAFCDHVRLVWLTPAMDSLFAGPASERRRFLDRFVLAIDPNHGARVGQFERALRGRNRLLEEGARNAVLARRDRARGGRTRRRGRRGAARMRAPPRGADRRRPRRCFALSLGASSRSRARSRRWPRAARRSRRRTATARCCATIAAATPPPAAR